LLPAGRKGALWTLAGHRASVPMRVIRGERAMIKFGLVLAAGIGLASAAGAQGIYGGVPTPYGGHVPSPGAGIYGGYGTGANPQSQGVQGYTNHNGGYVQPYERTTPNNTQTDNYGTRGNVNPYTGAYGTRTPRY